MAGKRRPEPVGGPSRDTRSSRRQAATSPPLSPVQPSTSWHTAWAPSSAAKPAAQLNSSPRTRCSTRAVSKSSRADAKANKQPKKAGKVAETKGVEMGRKCGRRKTDLKQSNEESSVMSAGAQNQRSCRNKSKAAEKQKPADRRRLKAMSETDLNKNQGAMASEVSSVTMKVDTRAGSSSTAIAACRSKRTGNKNELDEHSKSENDSAVTLVNHQRQNTQLTPTAGLSCNKNNQKAPSTTQTYASKESSKPPTVPAVSNNSPKTIKLQPKAGASDCMVVPASTTTDNETERRKRPSESVDDSVESTPKKRELGEPWTLVAPSPPSPVESVDGLTALRPRQRQRPPLQATSTPQAGGAAVVGMSPRHGWSHVSPVAAPPRARVLRDTTNINLALNGNSSSWQQLRSGGRKVGPSRVNLRGVMMKRAEVTTSVASRLVEPEVTFLEPARRSYSRRRHVSTSGHQALDQTSDARETSHAAAASSTVAPAKSRKRHHKHERAQQQAELDRWAASMNSLLGEVEEHQLLIERC